MVEKYMNLAIKDGIKAFKKNEIPVGAIIVKNDKIISKGRNNRQKKHYILGHAEVNAIIKAEKKIKDWRLNDFELYVTLEPCKMCKEIINEARIEKIYYIIPSLKKDDMKLDKYVQIEYNNKLVEEYKKIFQNYFKNLR